MENKNINKWIEDKKRSTKLAIDSCGNVDKETINQADLKYMHRARLVLLEELEGYLNGE